MFLWVDDDNAGRKEGKIANIWEHSIANSAPGIKSAQKLMTPDMSTFSPIATIAEAQFDSDYHYSAC